MEAINWCRYSCFPHSLFLIEMSGNIGIGHLLAGCLPRGGNYFINFWYLKRKLLLHSGLTFNFFLFRNLSRIPFLSLFLPRNPLLGLTNGYATGIESIHRIVNALLPFDWGGGGGGKLNEIWKDFVVLGRRDTVQKRSGLHPGSTVESGLLASVLQGLHKLNIGPVLTGCRWAHPRRRRQDQGPLVLLYLNIKRNEKGGEMYQILFFF